MFTPSLAQPPRTARLLAVDALRGAALLGILLVHCYHWFTADLLPVRHYQLFASGYLNELVVSKMELLLVDKCYTLFSFLFGLSFALMLSRSHDEPGIFYRRFFRRLAILAAIGLLHYLHWRGDILVVYAMLGGVLVICNRLANKWLLLLAGLLMLNLPVLLAHAYEVWSAPPSAQAVQLHLAANAQYAQANYQTLLHGGYLDTVVANASSGGRAFESMLNSGRIYQTLGFFLLGLYAGRRRLFEQLASNPSLGWKLLLGALTLVIGTKALLLLLPPAPSVIAPTNAFSDAAFKLIYTVRGVATTGSYIVGLTLLFESRLGSWAVPALSLVGRMALTNYLLQTLIGSWLFFGYGLGLQGNTPLWLATLLGLPIFLFQIAFSAYWLGHYRYGPVEWAWRSLTLGRAQPMRLPAGAAA
jgi:uncharacterized protein